ncbi:growth-regulating factor 7-like [Wolffia australiana]
MNHGVDFGARLKTTSFARSSNESGRFLGRDSMAAKDSFFDGHQTMISFSPPPPFHGAMGPFTPAQWHELEQQALIYQYLDANIPVPADLLVPIKRPSRVFTCAALRTRHSTGWAGFNADPEPGRCRRTDGKKWRCSRDAVVDQKYCERHINRGRHRSRKHVEALSAAQQPEKVAETAPASWIPVFWEPSMGGPLGEALSNAARNVTSSLQAEVQWESSTSCLCDDLLGSGTVHSSILGDELQRFLGVGL